MVGSRASLLGILSASVLLCAPVQAEEYKVGASVALSGYLAVIDAPWKDGVALGTEALNEKGGLLGRNVSLAFEDMRAEPAEAVTVVRKLLSSDKVGVLINGCSSAGNAAVAPLAGQAPGKPGTSAFGTAADAPPGAHGIESAAGRSDANRLRSPGQYRGP